MFSTRRSTRTAYLCPILFVTLLFLLMGYSYNTYQFYALHRNSSFPIHHLIFFNTLLLLGFVSYYRTCSTSPGFVSKEWAQKAEKLGLGTYCRHCDMRRPARAHHCSVTDRCVLRMDHFCPWTGNTIGFGNQKYFIQFLLWSGLAGLYHTIATIPTFMQFLEGSKKEGELNQLSLLRNPFGTAPEADGNDAHKVPAESVHFWIWFGAFCMGFSFALSLLGMGLFHVYMLFKNRTTLETGYLSDEDDYDQGSSMKNANQVCGACGPGWCLPLAATDQNTDGTYWASDDELEAINPQDEDALSGSGLSGSGVSSQGRPRASRRTGSVV